MKKILMLATGGTIASLETQQGLSPAITSEEILACVPEIRESCSVETLQLMNLDSTNIRPDDWIRMAEAVRENYEAFDGFVITHGTDTMAYTAAALSYLIQHSVKPVIITGAQKPISLKDTDARVNLRDSFLYAADDRSHDVSLIFDGKVILGTRARKERTKSYNAFSSVDFPEIAVIRDGKLIRYLEETKYGADDVPVFYRRLGTRVAVLTLIPGIDAAAVRSLKENHDALIIQSFGVGGLPGGGDGPLARAMQEWLTEEKPVVITTQVPYEGSDMSVYRVGVEIREKYPIIEAYNMTLEAVTAKLMWAMGLGGGLEEVRRAFGRPVGYDIL